ncbi:MAG: carbohydrate ABC transporter permease [bacterium]|nr:carbohydrate ABC transporter permease [bacterium]
MAELSKPFDSTREDPLARVQRPRAPLPWGRILTYLLLGFGAMLALLPFIMMVSWSLMPSAGEIYIGRTLPSRPAFENYRAAWETGNFSQYMWNSTRIVAITVIGTLLFNIPAAYAFARMKFFGRNVIFALLLATLMIPDIVTLIPNYLTVVWFSRLSEAVFGPAGKWLENWPSLTIPFTASAFTIFLLRQFFAQIPEDLWDAARIDGAGHLRFLRSVVLPLSRAPLATILIFTFIGGWNSLQWPLLVVRTDDWLPVSAGLLIFTRSEAGDEFHWQMAASVITILPILVIYFFTQKQFTEGIATTGSKG